MAGGKKGQKRSRASTGGAPTTKKSGPPRVDQEWVTSTCTEKDLRDLVADGLLPDRAVAGWRSTVDERLFPTPRNQNDLVVFVDFFRRGFGIPVHPFLHKLLDYYQICLVHLHPNSILHLSIFINLCEAFLGIPPISICSAIFFALGHFLELVPQKS